MVGTQAPSKIMLCRHMKMVVIGQFGSWNFKALAQKRK
jgi:hypothetical protein